MEGDRRRRYEPDDPWLADIHNYLVMAAETEWRLPSAINHNLKTYWPEMPGEKHVDFKPEKTPVTLCRATNRQIDDHAKAMEMVITGLDDKEDRRLVWAVAHSAAFRERGPKWLKIAKLAHTHRQTAKRRYEKALEGIYLRQVVKSSRLPNTTQSA